MSYEARRASCYLDEAAAGDGNPPIAALFKRVAGGALKFESRKATACARPSHKLRAHYCGLLISAIPSQRSPMRSSSNHV